MKAATKLAVAFLALCVLFAPPLSWIFPLVFAPLLPLHVLMISAFVIGAMLLYVAPLIWAYKFDQAETHREADGTDAVTWGTLPPVDSHGAAVVLIHGTFAHKNTWTKFPAALPAALARDAALVCFDWSGANSMHSRSIAVDTLRKCIRELDTLGYKRVALIAHSHAGNIALKACEDPATAHRVSAIICLATPFISAWRPRLLVTRGLYARIGVMITSAIAGGFLMLLVSAFTTSFEDSQSPRVLAIRIGALVVAVGIGAAGFSMSRRLRIDDIASLHEDIAGAVCDVAAVAPLRDRTLIITRGGDEADGMLKLASLLNRQIVGMVNRRTDEAWPSAGTVDIEPASVRDIFLSMAMGTAAFLGAVSSLAFGCNGLREQTGVFFTSAETPPGQWTHLQLSGVEAADGIGLYHSSLYEDPQAIKAIRGWLVGTRPAIATEARQDPSS